MMPLYGDFPGGTVVKNLPVNAGDARDMGSIPGSGRFPGERNGNTLQYSYLEYPMDRGAWRATVHGIFQARILECVAISFSRGSSRPRSQTQISCIEDRFFTDRAMRVRELEF